MKLPAALWAAAETESSLGSAHFALGLVSELPRHAIRRW